jgi:hypothetical protein
LPAEFVSAVRRVGWACWKRAACDSGPVLPSGNGLMAGYELKNVGATFRT